MIALNGIYPPLPTPFHENGDIYPEKIKENILKLMGFDLAGIVVLGSNGEFVMLTEQEKETVFSNAREVIPSDRVMIAGTGGQSTRETIRLTRLASKHGADAAMVLNPFYYKSLMTKDALVNHFHSVAEASEIPVIVYNIPGNTGMDMDAETIASLATHPNIIGLKDSGGNITKLADVINRTGNDFQVLAGSAGFLFPALSTGAIGGILALANIAPELCLGIYHAVLNKDADKARELQHKAISINTAITRKWGIPALKAAMDHMGLYGGTVRNPLLPLEEGKKSELVKILPGSLI